MPCPRCVYLTRRRHPGAAHHHPPQSTRWLVDGPTREAHGSGAAQRAGARHRHQGDLCHGQAATRGGVPNLGGAQGHGGDGLQGRHHHDHSSVCVHRRGLHHAAGKPLVSFGSLGAACARSSPDLPSMPQAERYVRLVRYVERGNAGSSWERVDDLVERYPRGLMQVPRSALTRCNTAPAHFLWRTSWGGGTASRPLSHA